MISVVILPTAMFTAKPLWCNPCVKGSCGPHQDGGSYNETTDSKQGGILVKLAVIICTLTLPL